jgi:hypothetical protein
VGERKKQTNKKGSRYLPSLAEERSEREEPKDL